MGRSLHSSTRDYDAERGQLASEFKELKLGHIQRINEINSDALFRGFSGNKYR